jgi:hypothetical protein
MMMPKKGRGRPGKTAAPMPPPARGRARAAPPAAMPMMKSGGAVKGKATSRK